MWSRLARETTGAGKGKGNVGVGDGEIKKTIQMAGGYSLRFPSFSIVLFKIQVLGVCGFLLETSQGFVCILVGTTDT